MQMVHAASGPVLPCLTFGTGGLGKTVDKATAFTLMDAYRAAAGSCIDTGRMYGGVDGASEEIIGSYLHARRCRHGVLLSTKGGFPHRENLHRSRLSASELEADLTASLRALRTDFTDLLFLHRDDCTIPVERLMPVLDRFVKAGTVRFLGASNWSAVRIAEANRFAVSNGLTPFTVSQLQWSLARATPADWCDDTIACMNEADRAFYQSSGMAVMAFSPLTRGFFTKPGAQAGTLSGYEAFASPLNATRARRAALLARELGVSVTQLCYSYLSSTSLHATAVMGCKSMAHLTEALGAQNLRLSPEQVAYLEAVDGTEGGTRT